MSEMPAPLSDRTFGFVLAGFFVVIGTVARFVFDAELGWPFWVAGTLAAVAVVAPWSLLPLNRLWGRLAHLLGNLNNRILLGTVYFLVIFPVAMIMRLVNRDPMERIWESRRDSYFTTVHRQTSAETLEDMF